MRIIFMFLPAVLLAQAPPAPKPPAAPAAPKPAAAAPKPAAAAAKLTTDDDKVVYSLGLTIYRSLGQFDLSPAEMEILKQALTDATQNKPALDLSAWGPKIDAF